MKAFNKEIYKIKLTLTTNCNLGCSYCFVEKNHKRMDESIAKKSINLLIQSPGNEKLLSLYGGEPFLEDKLIRFIVIYAKKMAFKLGKKLTISICTNLTIFNKDLIDFIKKNGVKLTVSLVGTEKYHNQYRKFVAGGGTYQSVVKNLKILAKTIPREDIGVSFVLFPSLSKNMSNNFNHILGLNVSDNINFEIVQEFKNWERRYREDFAKSYKKIISNVMKNILIGKFSYVNLINWEIARGMISEEHSVHCPFKYSLEVYPSGEMAFSPFLLNRDDSEQFIIGNVNYGFVGKYNKCNFDDSNDICRDCQNKYYNTLSDYDNSGIVRSYYEALSLVAVNNIKKRIKENKLFKIYIKNIKKHMCF